MLEDLDMNRFKAAICPVSFRTPLMFIWDWMLMIALIWSGLASIPHCVLMYLRNFPTDTLKENLVGLGFIPYLCMTLNGCC